MSGLGLAISDNAMLTLNLKPVSCELAASILHQMLKALAEPLRLCVSPAGLRLHTLSSGMNFAHHSELREQQSLVRSSLMW